MVSKPKKTSPRRYKATEIRQQFVDAVGSDQVEYELASGEVLTFPHPLFAEDEWITAVDDAESNRDKARAILGDEQYDKFVAAGHVDSEIGLIFLAVQQDMKDQVGRRPTRS